MAKKEDKNIDTELMHSLHAVLSVNDHGSHTIPAEGIYPHQWLWDSCFISIGLRHTDVERAKQEILSLLKGQWHNGMIPHMIFDSGIFYRSDRELWRSNVSYNAPSEIPTSGITQPPVLAEAIVLIGEKLSKSERKQWYKKTYGPLVRYHNWLYTDRDPNNTGLVFNVHPWETGMDDTPPWVFTIHKIQLPLWVSFIKLVHLDKLIEKVRRDTNKLPTTQRESTIDGLALVSVMQRLRRRQYNTKKIVRSKLLAIEDVAFNSILIRNNKQLERIAQTLGKELPGKLSNSIEKAESALEQLWDDEERLFYPRNFYNQKSIQIPSIGALLPLYSGSISKERASDLVKTLKDNGKFNLKYPVPSVPKNSPDFNKQRFWQGPTWVNTNWFIIKGLEQYGYQKEADDLRKSTIEMVKNAGPSEYFLPTNGKPAGANNFSWTAALTIDLINS